MSSGPERLNAEVWYREGSQPKQDPKWKPETPEEYKARLARQQAEMQAEVDEARSHNTKLILPILAHILSKPDKATYYGAEAATVYENRKDGQTNTNNRITESFLTIERGSQSIKFHIPPYDQTKGFEDHVYINPGEMKPELVNGKKASGDYPGINVVLTPEQKNQMQSAIDLAKKLQSKPTAESKSGAWYKFW